MLRNVIYLSVKYKDCRFEKVYVDTLEKRFGVSTSNANENGPGRADHTTLDIL